MVCDLSSRFTEPTIDHRPVGKKEKVRQEVGEKKPTAQWFTEVRISFTETWKVKLGRKTRELGIFVRRLPSGEDSRW